MNQAELLDGYKKLHKDLWPLQLQARTVRLAFFDMVREILDFYIKPRLIKNFKGQMTKSGHMPAYLQWLTGHDIYALIEHDEFRKLRDMEMSKSIFFAKLVHYPSVQNFICDKYFPQNEEDNLRQLLALPKEVFEPYIPQSQKKFEEEEESARDMNMYDHDRGVFEVVHLFENRNEQQSSTAANMGARTSQAYQNDHRLSQDIVDDKIVLQDDPETPERLRKFYQEQFYFPRRLDEQVLRKDFQDNHFRKASQLAFDQPDDILKKSFKYLGVSKHLAPVYELNYRLANYFERSNPAVDITVVWLFLFCASLDY